ncbi:uncharacterized protein si:dkey-63d15.12 isoform X2 [Astyanax mexicanus]|uniref:uncharacterized protein si:dkey-63d15.12 isoform X2 n=1 Tax=Astyanax mexicanus TaxID=7994 RepID=UPI0020CB50CC|nr:uncharacterized protein si:dkey-63d15.12 isoform X2 [Astyanax mexicanus]
MAHIHSVYTLLLSAFLTGCVCESDLTVWQNPERINAIEGQPVNINCSFKFNSTTELLKVKWLKNNTEVDKHEPYNISALRSQNFNSRTVSQTSVLHLPSVQLNDSGTYYCKVWYDVPLLGVKISEQGTELRVVPVNFTIVTSPAPPKPFAVTIMGVSALGLVLMTACITAALCITYKRRRKRPKDEGEDQPAQREDDSSVLYAALKILKPEDRKNTQATQQELKQDCSTDEVLYSGIRLKPQKQKHTVLSY